MRKKLDLRIYPWRRYNEARYKLEAIQSGLGVDGSYHHLPHERTQINVSDVVCI